MIKFFPLFFLFIIINLSNAEAQKVVRKGVRPVSNKQALPTTFYEVSQLTGKWQEYSRKSVAGNEAVIFSDSLMLNFYKRDSVLIKDGISISQKGVVAIDKPATLLLAGDLYTILLLNKNSLVINDGEFIRSLKKTKRFYSETLGNLKATMESFEKPLPVDARKLMGRWDVYRRQADPGLKDSLLIKSVTFTSVTKDALAGSIAYYSSSKTETAHFTGYISGTDLHINTGNINWQLSTYKASGDEFVFGRDKVIVYYAKKGLTH